MVVMAVAALAAIAVPTVYVHLFAAAPTRVGMHAAVFAGMTLLWCALAGWLVRHPRLGGRLQRQAHAALPFVLIALGLWILGDAWVLLRSYLPRKRGRDAAPPGTTTREHSDVPGALDATERLLHRGRP